MKAKAPFLILPLLLLSFLNAFAETAIKAQVDKTTITTDDTLVYKVIITSEEKNIPVPLIPEFEGFDILSQAQSSTVVFGKKAGKTNVVFVFILLARQAGRLGIAPAEIKVGGNTYKSEHFEIEVTQGKNKPQIPPEQRPFDPKKTSPEAEAAQTTL